MTTIETTARVDEASLQAARPDGTGCLEVQPEADRMRPEDVARSELFYNSTCCWV